MAISTIFNILLVCGVVFVSVSCQTETCNGRTDDGLLKRVGQIETSNPNGVIEIKTFYTSPWAPMLSWIEAQEFCNQAMPGMRLASIDSEREKQIVYTFFVGNTGKYYEFWLSATDYEAEGRFVHTRTGVPVPFNVSQGVGELAKQRNCLKLGYSTFYDEACHGWSSERTWPLCEIRRNQTVITPTTPTTTSTTTEPPPTTTAPPSPFTCPSEGMHPDPLNCTQYHVCVSYQDGFIDHQFSCPGFTNYCSEKKECGNPVDCPCSRSEPYFLQRSQDLSLRPVFRQYPVQLVGTVGQKTFYTDTQSRNLNWIQSMEFCHQNDMMMARMESEDERTLLLSKLNADYNIDMFWLSAMDYGTEGSYYWTSQGTPVDRSIYGNGGRASNCLYLSKGGPVYDWSCANHRNQRLWPLCQATVEE